MTVPQKKFRELVLQMLYSHDMGKPEAGDLESLMAAELSVPKKTVREAQERVNKIFENLPDIDSLITETSTSYAFDRIHSVERNVLRLGIFELFYDDTVPPKSPLPKRSVLQLNSEHPKHRRLSMRF